MSEYQVTIPAHIVKSIILSYVRDANEAELKQILKEMFSFRHDIDPVSILRWISRQTEQTYNLPRKYI